MEKNYRITKYACYVNNISMAAIANLSPLLFVTFRERFGISYTLLGSLVLINFCSQLLIDLIFSLFSRHFNIARTVRMTPLITIAGLLLYSVLPVLDPARAYLWLAVGTVIFSVSAGLTEVLVSPVVAAIPSERPESEMSKLHASYAWGGVGVVLFSTLFLKLFGRERWYFLSLLLTLIPLTGAFLFMKGKMPDMTPEGEAERKGGLKIEKGLMTLFVACIFLGGATENTMTQWVSGYAESALGISKVWGDIFGVAVFAAMLGLGRSLYAKFGKKILPVLLAGFCGSAVTYLVAGLSSSSLLGLIACALTGFCVSMLWPGSLILTEQRFPNCGVMIYALMAAGGDLGGSVAPQLMGWLTDRLSGSALAFSLAERLCRTPEQIGLKGAMILSAAFPVLGILLVLTIRRRLRKNGPAQKLSPEGSPETKA